MHDNMVNDTEQSVVTNDWDTNPCSVRDALNYVTEALKCMNLYAEKHGFPVEIIIPPSWIKACEKPFPLTEGNLALDEIEFFRIGHEQKGRVFSQRKNAATGALTLRLDKP